MAKRASDPISSPKPTSQASPRMGDAAVQAATVAKSVGEALAREMSARTILFHQAVADRMGISVTDHKCLDIAGRAAMHGPITAGKMAELTGLTTGAITGVLDRLEKGGFLRREKDPNDRRQVLVRLLPDRMPEYIEIFAPFVAAWVELCSRYTPEEMARVEDFMRTSLALVEKETERVRAMVPARKASSQETTDLSAPLGMEKIGYLEFPRGSTNTRLGPEMGPLLYRGRFVGATPRVTAQDGRVVLDYARGVFRGVPWKRSASEVTVHHSIPWHIVIRSGAAKLEADLRALTLRGFEISGGAAEIWLKLPRPQQTVSIRISGGISALTMLRPDGVPARLLVKGGASGLTIDTAHLGSVGGKMNWESPDFAQANDRYDIEVLGSASGLTVGTLPPVTYPTRENE